MGASASFLRADQPGLEKGCAAIRRGGIVAFPTETSYGMAVDPFNPDALKRLFALKRRPAEKPILVLIRHHEDLRLLVHHVPPLFERLMAAFWPGPLTLLFPALPGLPALLTGNTGTVGVRLSSHPVARHLVEQAGRPLTGTSANLSGKPACTNASQVAEAFPSGLEAIVDGGECQGGLGSTIVSLEGEQIKLVRDGVLPFDVIQATVGA